MTALHLVPSDSAVRPSNVESLQKGVEKDDDPAMAETPSRQEVDAKIKVVESDMKTIVADLRSDIHKVSSDISRWMLGTLLTIVSVLAVGFGGLVVTIYNGLKTPPAPASPPTIIYVAPPAAAAPPAPAASR